MLRRLTLPVLLLTTIAQTALGDWDRHFVHDCSNHLYSDANFDAFLLGVGLIIAASLAILLLVTPLLILNRRRIQDTLWTVPLVNLIIYICSITLRAYPGGAIARFHPPGLWYTITEVLLLLIACLIITLIVAGLQWIVNRIWTQK